MMIFSVRDSNAVRCESFKAAGKKKKKTAMNKTNWHTCSFLNKLNGTRLELIDVLRCFLLLFLTSC